MPKYRYMAAALMTVFTVALLPCSAQTISRVSGNGQLVRTVGLSRTLEPFVVLVKDAGGKPLVNWPVTWSVPDREGLLIGCDARTSAPRYSDKQELIDTGGKASCSFQAFSSLGSAWYQSSTVTAAAMTADGQSVVAKTEFYVTTLSVSGSGVIYGQRQLVYPEPSSGITLSGRAGTVSSPPIQVYMAANGQPIANVGLRLVLERNEFTGDLPEGTIGCSEPEGIALTDTTGMANCHPVFGGKAGQGKFTIVVGGYGYQDSPGWRFEVLPGAPASIQILSGDNQAPGTPGAELTGTLLARVIDAGSNALPDVPATWTPMEPGCVSIATATQVSDQYGQVSARVKLGNAPGTCRVKLTVGAPGASAETIFTVKIRGTAATLTKISGDGQQATAGSPFSAPLTVELLDRGKPLAGAAVKFSAVTGDATILTPDTVTDLQGHASTQVRAGNMAGTVLIRASAANLTQDFSLTQIAVTPGGGTPGDSSPLSVTYYPAYVSGQDGRHLAPCSLATIRVPSGVADMLTTVPALEWPRRTPYTLSGVSVQFQSVPAPIYQIADVGGKRYVSVQVPCSLSMGTATVAVAVQGRSTVSDTVEIVPAAPVILQSPDADGVLRATLVRADGTIATRDNPAERGEHVRIFVSGLGQTSPALVTARLGFDEQVGIPIVRVADQVARIAATRYSQNLLGVYEVEFDLPASLPWGDVVIAVETGTGQGYQHAESKLYLRGIF